MLRTLDGKVWLALASGLAVVCAAYSVRRLRTEHALRQELDRLRVLLDKEKGIRQAERAGRTRAERALRSRDRDATDANTTYPPEGRAQHGGWRRGGSGAAGSTNAEAARTQTASDAASSGQLAFNPIATITSCFSQRNGTPRQPLLVPAARARIELLDWVPPLALDGLEGYSHCWILYIFHANTDGLQGLDPTLGPPKPGATFRAKVRVPRLDGKKMGVLATRSPHRPVPIGLTLAKVESVKGRTVIISGADIVDGSPVVDIKPYIPFCEAIHEAVAPEWVQVEAPKEPLRIDAVRFEAGAEDAIRMSWVASNTSKAPRCLSDSATAFVQLVTQVLSRDIRSYHKRTKPGNIIGCAERENHRPISKQAERAHSNDTEYSQHSLHVILEGVEVAYHITDGQCVVTGGRHVTQYAY